MENQSSLFDQCKTSHEIHIQLQHLVKELLMTIQNQEISPPVVFAENGTIALSVLSKLSYSVLKQYDHPVFLLSEISRLLFKLGDQQSLKQCLTLSHIMYAFKCKQHESRYISCLYKGIAQIGLQMTDLGIKNVSICLSKPEGFILMPVDKALGYWALMSAAITNKNLKLALSFAEKWQYAAKEGGLQGENFRSQMSMTLIHILFGEQEMCSQKIEELIASPPEEWKTTVNFLVRWVNAMSAEKSLGMLVRNEVEGTSLSEPHRLFLGFDWHRFGEHDPSPGEFSGLCDVRQRYCCKNAARMLSTKEIKWYADLMAQWELPGPLCEFETILKERDHDEYFRCNLTRLLGTEVLQKVLAETPIDSTIARRDDAIIWVMDVRKFSALSEHRSPEEIFDLLNPVFKIISEELEPVGGTILEFIGDSMILVFNIFREQRSEMLKILFHTIRSLQRIYVLNAISHQSAVPDIRIGVGMNKGSVALGYLGGLKRCHLTVLGNTINLAARLESASKELPGDAIVSAACFDNNLPNVWAEPLHVNFSLRDLGSNHTLKNISKPVRLFGISPLLPYWVDFVPMGFVAFPERGVVYLDTGNSDKPGIVDHHFEGCAANSACELLLQKPKLLLEHVSGLAPSQIEFRLHTTPDPDCAATLYAAQELLKKTPRKQLLWKLAEYVSKIDQARIPHPEWMCDSLYGVFKAHQLLAIKHDDKKSTDAHLLEAGLRVLDAAMFLMQEHLEDGNFASIFRFRPSWFAEEKKLLQDDLRRYQEDLKLRSHTYRAHVNGIAEPVTGLWLDHPQSVFFRIWGWNDTNTPDGQGYPFLVVDFSQPGKKRFVIGVNPESGLNLYGLGQLLEKHEADKRKKLGKERPIYPIRHPADNSDPWQGHGYAVIDSPGQGTVLNAEEVQQIHENWKGATTTDLRK